MDFEIGNLFYIIITLVVIIIGLLGKKRKPADQGTDETERKAQPGFFENLEKMFNMEQGNQLSDLRDYEEELPVKEEVMEPVPEPVTETGGIMEEYERMMAAQRHSGEGGITQTGTETLTEPLEVIDLEEKEGTDYFEVIRGFDAGKAVVYSAIINRIDY